MTTLQNRVLTLRSKIQMEDIVQYVGGNRARFSELTRLVTSGDPELARRAAWPLSYCVSRHPQLAKPHIPALVEQLEKPCHPAVSRNILRLLQQIPIPETDQGRLMDYCFSALMKRETPAANKAFALTILAKLAISYPEIGEEILLCIEAQWPGALPSFRARAKKVIRQLKKKTGAGYSHTAYPASGFHYDLSTKFKNK